MTAAGAGTAAQADRAPLMFVGRCERCGRATDPVPAEGPGETWQTADAWVYLTLIGHKRQCTGPAWRRRYVRPAVNPATGQLPLFHNPAGPGGVV